LKLSFAHGVVRGMEYLHSLKPSVIHSDLKPENVLVSDKLVAKVSKCHSIFADVELSARRSATLPGRPVQGGPRKVKPTTILLVTFECMGKIQ